MDDLRGALIGFGLAGSVFHGPLITATPGLQLSTIVTANAERAGRARSEYPGARVVPQADTLWERPDEHDFVVVATPNDSHASLARSAVDAGLPVVVDKPLAPTSGTARELIEHARSRGIALTVFHNRRWDSDQLTLKRLIADGVLGDVHRYESRFERWRPQLAGGGVWREQLAADAGGGVLLDIGIHLVDQALQLFGPAFAMHGEVDHRRAGPADDDDFIALQHPGGVRSHLWASVLAAAPGPRLRVLGSEAAYIVDGLDGQEEALRSGARPGADEWGTEPPERWGRVVRGDVSESVPSENGAWPRFYGLWREALAGSGPLPVDPADAVAVLALLEQARAN